MGVLVEHLRREWTLSWRRIRTSPGPALFAVLTLALGVGVTVATYSVVYSALWRPLGVLDESRLALLGKQNSLFPGSARISLDDYQSFARNPHGFERIAAWTPFTGPLAGLGTAEIVSGEAVTGSYFHMLGVRAAAGRLLEPDDDRADVRPVAVLSYRMWREQFGLNPDVVGGTIKIDDRPYQIVGITPPGFRGVHPTGFIAIAAWVPFARAAVLAGEPAFVAAHPRSLGMFVAARLGPAQTWESASRDMTAAGEQLDAASPGPVIPGTGAGAERFRRWWTTAHVSDDQTINQRDAMGRLIVGLPALVLLIACTNIANLVLSRGVARRQDFAIRRALGATRWRLIREQLMEQTIVTVAGGAAGVLIAHGLVGVAGRAARESLAPFLRGAQLDWSLDAGVLTSTGVAVLLSIVVAGLLPALHLTRDSLRSVLDQGGTAATPKWRGRANLVAVQVGLSVGLFLVAVVFVRMMLDDSILRRNLVAVTPGSDRIAVAAIPFRMQQRDEARTLATVDAVLDEIRRSPEVVAAAASSEQPFARGLGVANFFTARLRRPDQTATIEEKSRVSSSFTAVSPDFFTALNRPILSGRGFLATDTRETTAVAIINEGLAIDVFGTRDAIGRDVVMGVQDRLVAADAPVVERTATVVGIVPGAKMMSGRVAQHVPELYVPFAQQPPRDVAILVRAGGRRAPIDALRAAIKKVDPELAIGFVAPANVLEGGPVMFIGYIVTILLTLAFTALCMAMAGLYGVLSHVMARRTREMGIRIAIGATTARIVTMVLRDGFRPILEGLFIGLATATVFRIFLRMSLGAKEIAPLDPLACLVAAVLVIGAGSVACYLPARRAASVDPNVALRAL